MQQLTSAETGGSPRRVLIVDDDGDFAESLGENVEILGYEIQLAHNPAAAAQALDEFPADAALLDIRLGHANGVDLIARLTEIRPQLQCVMMTAYASVETAISAMRAGAYDFLCKPFHPEELDFTLRRTFDRIGLLESKSRAERALRRYEHIVSATSDLMGFVDRDYVFRAVNSAYLNAYQLAAGDVVGRQVCDVHGDAWFEEHFREGVDRCLRGEKFHAQAWLEFPTSGRRYMDLGFYPYLAEDGAESGVVVGLRDLTEMHQLSERLDYEATHDALTGLFNRREFESRLRMLLANSREEGTHHALCYLGLDDFKLINDRGGHRAGDELLREVGRMLCRVARRGDTFARLGGDEFGVLMAGCSVAQAHRVAEKLLRTLRQYRFEWEGTSYPVRGTIGIVPIEANGATVTDVMIQADAACHVAKDEGGDRIRVYTEGDAGLAAHHGEMLWATRVRSALDEERFRLYRQRIAPIGADADAAPRHEFLLRLVEPDGEVVSAGVFLSAIERYSLASNVDRWVCAKVLDWLEAHGRELADVAMVSINLSGRSLGDVQLLDYLLSRLPADEDR
ncbi:MAG: diguanylate cyclase domain-containing protein, partial [Gammaproteobacteria bacterium]